jgi:hypothetical protein
VSPYDYLTENIIELRQSKYNHPSLADLLSARDGIAHLSSPMYNDPSFLAKETFPS